MHKSDLRSILLKAILLPHRRLGLLILMSEVGLEARAEVDVPAPEPTYDRFRILVVVRSQLTVFAGILCHMEEMMVQESNVRILCRI